jgi:hypothetical protein
MVRDARAKQAHVVARLSHCPSVNCNRAASAPNAQRDQVGHGGRLLSVLAVGGVLLGLCARPAWPGRLLPKQGGTGPGAPQLREGAIRRAHKGHPQRHHTYDAAGSDR